MAESQPIEKVIIDTGRIREDYFVAVLEGRGADGTILCENRYLFTAGENLACLLVPAQPLELDYKRMHRDEQGYETGILRIKNPGKRIVPGVKLQWDCEPDSGVYGDFSDNFPYLLPGEEKLFTMREDWLHWTVEDAADFDFPDSWFGKLYFVTCLNAPHCPRVLRPLQCRFFPLAPHIDENGALRLILSDLELPYRCPLIAGRMLLTPSFIQASYTVWKHLIRDSLILDLVVYDSSFRQDDALDYLI